MTTFRALRFALIVTGITVGLAPTAAAQTNDEIFPNLEWNFSTPGARANGMGRTFIGVADDATAAITNPAGLVSLTKPQFYLEYKNTKLKIDRLAAADSLFTLQPTTFEKTIDALSFLSVSAPINDKIAVGFSLHRYLDHHESFTLAPRPVPNISVANFSLFPIDGAADFTGTSFGGSIAYQVTGALRVGATIAGSRLQATSVATRRGFIAGPTFPGNRFDIVGTNIIRNETSIDDTQIAISASVGALYKVNEVVSVGVDYAKSPRFKTTENLRDNPGFDRVPQVNLSLTPDPNPKEVAINVPDHFGFGVSIRPTSRLLIAADVVRMQYSSLSKTTALIFFEDLLTGTEYATPDVTELHFGGEFNIFNIMQKHPVFVRAGVFTNPNHLTRFTGTTDPDINAIETAFFNKLPGKDETRGTVGAGIVFGTRFQVDAAYVVGKEFVASTGVRF
jgi:long-subunit fatty acid transport protein